MAIRGAPTLCKLTILALVCLVNLAASAASARVDRICGAVGALTLAYRGSRATQAIPDPSAMIDTLGRLSADLRRDQDLYASPELRRIGQKLTGTATSLRRAERHPRQDSRALAAIAFATLADVLDDLARLDDLFGCAPTPQAAAVPDAPPSLRDSGSLSRVWSRIVESASSLGVYAVIFGILSGFVLSVGLLRFFRRQNVRHLCSIPLHIVYGEECTVTRIIDISRGGIRVEATAEKNVENEWVDLNFGGIRIEGKIVWRNQFFAGAKFRNKLSMEALARVLEKNRVSLGDAGIEKTSTPCFYAGCHVNCERHLPTAIALKSQGPAQNGR